MSTPISKFRARSGVGGGAHGARVSIEEVDSFSDEGASDDSVGGDGSEGHDGGADVGGGGATTETREPFEYSPIDDLDNDGDEGHGPGPVYAPERAFSTQRRVRKSTKTHRKRSQDSVLPSAPIWRAVVSKPFCQAIFLTFAIVCAVTLSPLATLITDRVPSIAHIPHVKPVISSLIAAVLVTAMRPPIAGLVCD